jgi:hypothetical protein
MTPDDIIPLFTRADGSFLCARWGRPIVPVIFGVEAQTLGVLKGAIEAVVAMAGHKMAETDAELGANLMMFFFRDWAELNDLTDLDRMVPGIAGLIPKLEVGDAHHYRHFRFDEAGAIKACFVFVRMGPALAELSAETIALTQAVQMILSWSDAAFASVSPMALLDGAVILRPEIAKVIRATYDPVLPPASRDPSHGLRLLARIGRG